MDVAEIFFLSVMNPWVRWPPSGRSSPMMRPWGSARAVYTAKLAGEPEPGRPGGQGVGAGRSKPQGASTGVQGQGTAWKGLAGRLPYPPSSPPSPRYTCRYPALEVAFRELAPEVPSGLGDHLSRAGH